MNDYRLTPYCLPFKDIGENKKILNKRIKKCHSKLKIIYNQISKSDSQCRKSFRRIYNNKCAYCGNTTENLYLNSFEIDHYINEASFISKINAGALNNLVFSCYDCNRGKRDIRIKGRYQKLLNPDTNEIAKVFYRDEKYYIKITTEYSTDDFIVNFYDKLKLGNQTRRLDFLLLNMRGLLNTVEKKEIKNKMREAIMDLEGRRKVFQSVVE